jgi:hypothetical protein
MSSFPDPVSSTSMASDPVSSTSMASAELLPTIINGHGLWDSWMRNFRSPLTALLDLMDNACDAAAIHPGFPGKIHVMADVKSRLCIINNSVSRIKCMAQILEVHHSTKGKNGDSVGENGVGLKQGVATLTDLGFVLLRNDKELSLGIIAKDIQQEDGCCLPAFNLDTVPSGDVSVNSLQAICTMYPRIAECFRKFGDGDLAHGLERIVRHFDTLTQSPEWKDFKYVFLLALNTLKHSGEQADNQQQGEHNTISSSTTTQYYTRNLMKELCDEIPRHYIHIPSSFDMRVNRHRIQFEHWQRNLVDLTHFKVNIVKNESFKDDKKWKEVTHRLAKDWYPLNIYCGFDPNRANNQSSAKLLIYSRRCGRLVCSHDDARQMLGLTTGTSSFCQGMTIIVDDRHGHLPLNPTKQDVAFGEEQYGKVHKTNLEAWVGACAWTWWMVQLDACGTSKEILSKRIQEAHSPGGTNVAQTFPPLHLCRLTTFGPTDWCSKNSRIRPKKRDTIEGGETNQMTMNLINLIASLRADCDAVSLSVPYVVVLNETHTIWRIDRTPPPEKAPTSPQKNKTKPRKRSRSSEAAEPSTTSWSKTKSKNQRNSSQAAEQSSTSVAIVPQQSLNAGPVPWHSNASHRSSFASTQNETRLQPPFSPLVASVVQISSPSGSSGSISSGGPALSESREEAYVRKIALLEKQLKKKERLVKTLTSECRSLKERLRIANGEDSDESDDED